MAKAPKEKTKGRSLKPPTRIVQKGPLTPDMLRKLDATGAPPTTWRRTALPAGQPAAAGASAPRAPQAHLGGPLGYGAGPKLIYTHLNRVITRHELNMIYVSGPGHGGNAVVAQTYLEGTYSEFYPNVSQDEEGMRRLFRQSPSPAASAATAPRDPRLHQRGGRAGLLPGPRLWRGDGQPDPDRRLRSG